MGSEPGRNFQETTRYDRDRMEPHFLDWDSQPPVYKEYTDKPSVGLPAPSFETAVDLKDVVARRRSVRTFSRKPVTLQKLATMLWASTGITKRTADFAYRAAPSAGALYPVETYVVANNVEGLEPGLYHYNVKKHALEELRRGMFGKGAAEAALDQNIAAFAAVDFIWTAVFGRSVWKYRQRAFRYVYLDCGHIAGQLAMAAVALGLGSCNIAAIYDGEMNALLGVDGDEESVLYMSCVGVPR
jgi:SagB-type dehydrogenase family enzyme